MWDEFALDLGFFRLEPALVIGLSLAAIFLGLSSAWQVLSWLVAWAPERTEDEQHLRRLTQTMHDAQSGQENGTATPQTDATPAAKHTVPAPGVAAPRLMPKLDPQGRVVWLYHAGERRAALRRRGGETEVIIAPSEDGQEPAKGMVIDRSQGGLCLSVAQPVAGGSVLRLRVTNAPEDLPWIEVMVRNCRQKDERWLLGCKFVEELPWSVLLLFG
jgi:hypothetical protein